MGVGIGKHLLPAVDPGEKHLDEATTEFFYIPLEQGSNDAFIDFQMFFRCFDPVPQ